MIWYVISPIFVFNESGASPATRHAVQTLSLYPMYNAGLVQGRAYNGNDRPVEVFNCVNPASHAGYSIHPHSPNSYPIPHSVGQEHFLGTGENTELRFTPVMLSNNPSGRQEIGVPPVNISAKEFVALGPEIPDNKPSSIVVMLVL